MGRSKLAKRFSPASTHPTAANAAVMNRSTSVAPTEPTIDIDAFMNSIPDEVWRGERSPSTPLTTPVSLLDNGVDMRLIALQSEAGCLPIDPRGNDALEQRTRMRP
jgi:hypothetical protein